MRLYCTLDVCLHCSDYTFQCVPTYTDVLEFSRTEQQRRKKRRNPSRRLTLTIKSSVYYKSLINVIQNLEHINLMYKAMLAATTTAPAAAPPAMAALNFYPE